MILSIGEILADMVGETKDGALTLKRTKRRKSSTSCPRKKFIESVD